MEGSQLFLVEKPSNPRRREIPKHEVVMKCIELFLACASWMTYSMGIGTGCLHVRHAVANSTFGAFVIIGTIALIGYLLAQPMPRVLQITCDSIAFVFLSSSGMLMVESWWQFEEQMPGLASVDGKAAALDESGANMQLGAGLFAISASAFHLADAFIHVIRHDFT